MVAGKFDPFHNGHDDHLYKAKKLGDILIAVTHRDGIIAKISKKGFCAVPLNERINKLYKHGADLVVVSCDEDGTVIKTLQILRPTIFAKGGDRTIDNMPKDELIAAESIGCKIIYGVGDLLNSSTRIMKEVNH